VSATVTRDAEGTITGNSFDKYGSTNPVFRRIMNRFEHNLGNLFESIDPASVLDVGCGEGVLTHKWAIARPQTRVVGFDLDDPALQAEWAERQAPNLEYRVLRAQEPFPFGDGEFALATAIEVLEHVPDPEHTVAEMARCARGGHLLVSVPREPFWRALNFARGAYVRELGNSPGHINHWSKRAFTAMLSRHGEVVEDNSPFPWTMLLVRV
jgi:2-polyprenyl-3-methyl-5-hydroxy-6-metoxy-1,4-benzoquinol methylase